MDEIVTPAAEPVVEAEGVMPEAAAPETEATEEVVETPAE